MSWGCECDDATRAAMLVRTQTDADAGATTAVAACVPRLKG